MTREDRDPKKVGYECGICAHYHPALWNGDCRDDANRFSDPDVFDELIDENHVDDFQRRHTQRVIFRVWRSGAQAGEVIALFPDQTEANGTIGSYMHIGQHGPASPAIIHGGLTRLARPDEYTDLLRELESIGYHLTIRKRYSRA